jgi:hypothetical protein
VEVDVKTGAALAASLAANGVCPTNQKQCVLSDVARMSMEMLPRVTFSDKEEVIISLYPHLFRKLMLFDRRAFWDGQLEVQQF